MRICASSISGLVLVCCQAVSCVVKGESTCGSTSGFVLGCSQALLCVVKSLVAQLLDLFWCAAKLFCVVKSESTCSLTSNGAARLFHVLLIENQRVAQLLKICFGVLPGCFMCC